MEFREVLEPDAPFSVPLGRPMHFLRRPICIVMLLFGSAPAHASCGAFLHAAGDEPDDDTIRLVAADFLEENPGGLDPVYVRDATTLARWESQTESRYERVTYELRANVRRRHLLQHLYWNTQLPDGHRLHLRLHRGLPAELEVSDSVLGAESLDAVPAILAGVGYTARALSFYPDENPWPANLLERVRDLTLTFGRILHEEGHLVAWEMQLPMGDRALRRFRLVGPQEGGGYALSWAMDTRAAWTERLETLELENIGRDSACGLLESFGIWGNSLTRLDLLAAPSPSATARTVFQRGFMREEPVALTDLRVVTHATYGLREWTHRKIPAQLRRFHLALRHPVAMHVEEDFDGFRGLRELRSFELSRLITFPQFLRDMSATERAAQLEEVTLFAEHDEQEQVPPTGLGAFHTLRSLELSRERRLNPGLSADEGAMWSGAWIVRSLALSAPPLLRRLALSMRLTDDDQEILANAALPGLVELDMRSAPMTAATLNRFLSAPWFSSVHTMRIGALNLYLYSFTLPEVPANPSQFLERLNELVPAVPTLGVLEVHWSLAHRQTFVPVERDGKWQWDRALP